MRPSIANTITVPGVPTTNPATLYVAIVPSRLLVRNTGGTLILLAYSSTEIQSVGATSGVFRLPAGASEAFVLSPKQGMWAVSLGGDGEVSIAGSEAIPMTNES